MDFTFFGIFGGIEFREYDEITSTIDIAHNIKEINNIIVITANK